MLSKINEIIAKVPITIIALCYFAYLGYLQYDFKTSDQSTLALKNKDLEDTKRKRDLLQKKLAAVTEFSKNVDKRKRDLIQSVSELQSLKDAIPERIDLPVLMKVLFTEAKKVGLNLQEITPGAEVRKEYYAEQSIAVSVGGTYHQILGFFDRLASLTQIIQVDTFELGPARGNAASKSGLEAKISVKFYRYLGTAVDSIGKPVAAPSGAPVGAPAVTQPRVVANSSSNSPMGGVHP